MSTHCKFAHTSTKTGRMWEQANSEKVRSCPLGTLPCMQEMLPVELIARETCVYMQDWIRSRLLPRSLIECHLCVGRGFLPNMWVNTCNQFTHLREGRGITFSIAAVAGARSDGRPRKTYASVFIRDETEWELLCSGLLIMHLSQRVCKHTCRSGGGGDVNWTGSKEEKSQVMQSHSHGDDDWWVDSGGFLLA